MEDAVQRQELLETAGLTAEELDDLVRAGLLKPDRAGGCFRRRLVHWAGKLACLLHEGWTVDEIKSWTLVRWTTGNPRAWPPEHGPH